MNTSHRIMSYLSRLFLGASKVSPLVRVEVSTSALLHNVSTLQSLAPNWAVAPVLKANAYGHGIVEVANILESSRVPFFAVDSYFEAQLLRSRGVCRSILVMGFSHTDVVQRNVLKDIAFAVGSFEQLQRLIASGSKQRIQIKFDTGMHRRGISVENVSDVVELLKKSQLRTEGVFSHLAESETDESMLTEKQIFRWNALVDVFQKEFPEIRHYHLANSGGFKHASKINATVGRSGIALYGINPGNLENDLHPVMRMTAVVGEVHVVEPGESIGYNATFKASVRAKIATVPVGYYEGVDRRVSNIGVFLISGLSAPIRGRVSMNMTLCDVTEIDGVKEGTEVTVLSNHRNDENSVESIARQCGTIPYEILVHIPAHLRRVVVD